MHAMCIRCGTTETPQPLGYCPSCAANARSELMEGLKSLGEYLSSWAGFDDWLRPRPPLEVRERGPELLEAREAVSAREEVDVGESRLHAACERFVGRILLERVEPDHPVCET